MNVCLLGDTKPQARSSSSFPLAFLKGSGRGKCCMHVGLRVFDIYRNADSIAL